MKAVWLLRILQQIIGMLELSQAFIALTFWLQLMKVMKYIAKYFHHRIEVVLFQAPAKDIDNSYTVEGK